MSAPCKQIVIDSILHVLCHNILGDRQLRSRIIGFRGELEFVQFMSQWPIPLFHGGMFVPTQEKYPALDSTIYFTLLAEGEDKRPYLPIYQKIAQLDPIDSFLITYHLAKAESKNGFQSPPVFQFHQFQNGRFVPCDTRAFFNHYKLRKKAYSFKPMKAAVLADMQKLLKPFDVKALLQIYAERYFFDCCLSAKYVTGISSDLDIIYWKNGQFRFGEIKEKYLAKAIKGFGLDLHRSRDMYCIHQKTQTPYYIFIKEVDKRKERNFINWHSITIDDFMKYSDPQVIEGGAGMRSRYSSNPTTICPLEHFREIPQPKS